MQIFNTSTTMNIFNAFSNIRVLLWFVLFCMKWCSICILYYTIIKNVFATRRSLLLSPREENSNTLTDDIPHTLFLMDEIVYVTVPKRNYDFFFFNLSLQASTTTTMLQVLRYDMPSIKLKTRHLKDHVIMRYNNKQQIEDRKK